MAPSGDHAAVYAAANLSQDCGFHWMWAAVRVSDGTVTPLREQTYLCGSLAGTYGYGGMAWTPDSRRLTVPLQYFEDQSCGVFVYQTVVTTWDVGGTAQILAPITDLYLAGPSYTADGALLSAYQWNARTGGCTLGLRPAANLGTTAAASDLPYDMNGCTFQAPDIRGPTRLAGPRRATPPRPALPPRPQRDDCQPLAPPKR